MADVINNNTKMSKNSKNLMDPLGYNNQTEILLIGLGANLFTNEFKKRNISTEVLHKMTKQDFIQIGIDEKLAKQMVNDLNVARRKTNTASVPIQGSMNLLQILKNGETQLSLLHVFLQYNRYRLETEQVNVYVDANKCTSASEILNIATSLTLKELENLEQDFHQLQTVSNTHLFSQNQMKSKSRYYLWILLGGSLPIITYALLRSTSNSIKY